MSFPLCPMPFNAEGYDEAQDVDVAIVSHGDLSSTSVWGHELSVQK